MILQLTSISGPELGGDAEAIADRDAHVVQPEFAQWQGRERKLAVVEALQVRREKTAGERAECSLGETLQTGKLCIQIFVDRDPPYNPDFGTEE